MSGASKSGEEPSTDWSRFDQLRGAEAEATWRWLVERYRPVVERVLRLHVPSRFTSASLEEFWGYLFTSNVFERAARSSRFRPFLTGVVRNYASDWLRRHAPSGFSLEEGSIAVDGMLDVEREEATVWAQHVVSLALSMLEEDHPADASALRWFYGIPEQGGAGCEPVPVAEIARRLDRGVNAIHQVLHRGRGRLRTCIEAQLRDTVSGSRDLREELALVVLSLAREAPGLIEL